MAVYQYIAVLRTGDRITGRESAASATEVVARLQARSAFPLHVREGDPNLFWRRLRGAGVGNGQSAVVMTAELGTLISAGLTVDRALSIALERSHAGGFKNTLIRVRDAVRGGMALADAMEAEFQRRPLPRHQDLQHAVAVGLGHAALRARGVAGDHHLRL